MRFSEYRQAFDRNGFVVVRQFLDDGDFHELKAQLDRYIREVVPTLPDSAAFYQDRDRPETLKQMQQFPPDSFFDSCQCHPRWVALAEALLGEPAMAAGPEWFNKPPGTVHPTPPHQDNFYINRQPPNLITMWLALDPVDEENGCLRYVIGSHKHGLRPHCLTEVLGFSKEIANYGNKERNREQAIYLDPNDVVVHHGETIHRADPNRTTDRQRRAFAQVFSGVSSKIDEAALARHDEGKRSQHVDLGLKVT